MREREEEEVVAGAQFQRSTQLLLHRVREAMITLLGFQSFQPLGETQKGYSSDKLFHLHQPIKKIL